MDDTSFHDCLGRLLHNLGSARLIAGELIKAWSTDKELALALESLPLVGQAEALRRILLDRGQLKETRHLDQTIVEAKQLELVTAILARPYRVVPSSDADWPTIRVGEDDIGRKELMAALKATRDLVKRLQEFWPKT